MPLQEHDAERVRGPFVEADGGGASRRDAELRLHEEVTVGVARRIQVERGVEDPHDAGRVRAGVRTGDARTAALEDVQGVDWRSLELRLIAGGADESAGRRVVDVEHARWQLLVGNRPGVVGELDVDEVVGALDEGVAVQRGRR